MDKGCNIIWSYTLQRIKKTAGLACLRAIAGIFIGVDYMASNDKVRRLAFLWSDGGKETISQECLFLIYTEEGMLKATPRGHTQLLCTSLTPYFLLPRFQIMAYS
jgi:hypothetical protein